MKDLDYILQIDKLQHAGSIKSLIYLHGYIFDEYYYLFLIYLIFFNTKNLEVDGCPSKENLFEQSALLMNATYIAFP